MQFAKGIGIRRFSLVIFLSLLASCAATSSENYNDILTSANRPDAEKALDAVRKPNEVMAFYEVKRGAKVADLFASRGYYTAILSQLVGPEGVVYSANTTARPELHEITTHADMHNQMIAFDRA